MLFRNEVHVQQKMLPVGEDFVFQTGFNKDVLCKKALSEKNKTEDPSIRRRPERQMTIYHKNFKEPSFVLCLGERPGDNENQKRLTQLPLASL